jgi:hypothetical protein
MSISLSSIGHTFSIVLHGLHTGLAAVERILPTLQQQEPLLERITSLLPGAGAQTALTIERVAFAGLGELAAAVQAADAATLGNGLDLKVDGEVALAVKKLLTDFSAELIAAGLVKPKAVPTV